MRGAPRDALVADIAPPEVRGAAFGLRQSLDTVDAFLGWLFIRHWFAPLLPADQLDSYIAGLILLAAAPCKAMVFVWSRLTNADPLCTLSQVALNDTIMVFAFAPLVDFLLGISAITVPWATLVTSIVLYIVIPVLLAHWLRKSLLAKGQVAFDAAMARIGHWSISALLATLMLLFAFQGEAILKQPLVIALLAVSVLIQVFFKPALAYWLNRALGEKHSVACPLRRLALPTSSNWPSLPPSVCSAYSRARHWPLWLAYSSKCPSCCWWYAWSISPVAGTWPNSDQSTMSQGSDAVVDAVC